MENGLFSLPTPFTPPTTEEDELVWLRLIRSRRVGPTTFWRLLGETGSAQNALESLPEVARAAGVKSYEPCSEAAARAELAAGRRAGARPVFRGQPGYPAILAEIADAPPMLWAIGDAGLAGRPAVAVIGARNASSLGYRMARRLAEDVAAAGYAVVSGLARGIDAAAHGAALPATIAVQAGGIDVIYPAENTALAAEIAGRGLRLSEQPPGLQPQARHFPQRNRIIAGLARAVIVVEAAARSGSLITARMALDQGREVLAVPGHPMDGRAGGCNALIRDGAVLVRGADDVLAALGGAAAPIARVAEAAAPPPRPPAAPPPGPPERPRAETRDLHAQILDRLGPSPTAEDQLIRDLRLPATTVSAGLVELELDGRVSRQPGGLFARSD